MKKGKGQSLRKKDPEPRIMVDTFATLYLLGKLIAKKTYIINYSELIIVSFFLLFGFVFFFLYLGVSQAEAGNYTCYVDKVNMLKVKVIVVSRSLLLSQGKNFDKFLQEYI